MRNFISFLRKASLFKFHTPGVRCVCGEGCWGGGWVGYIRFGFKGMNGTNQYKLLCFQMVIINSICTIASTLKCG